MKIRNLTKEEWKQIKRKRKTMDKVDFVLLSTPLGPRDKKPTEKDLKKLKKAIEGKEE